MSQLRKISAATAFVASLSMAVPQLAASEVPVAPVQTGLGQSTQVQDGFAVWDADALNVERDRRYRRGYRRNRVDAGDVIAGIAIIGTIAAIANASSRNKRAERRYPRRDERYQERRGETSSDLQRATSACMQEIERNVRVESVDAVNRSAQGWSVTGRLYDGQGFYCNVDSNGRVSNVDFGSQAGGFGGGNLSAAENNQWDDARYREARRRAAANGALPTPTRGNAEYASYPAAASSANSGPAYPGGPVQGDYAYPEVAYSENTGG